MSKVLGFSELLITKLLHDIAGTVGAISNGFELLEDQSTMDMQSRILGLMKSNSSEVSNKLIYFRFLYGHSVQDTQIDFVELKKVISAFLSYQKINFDFCYNLDKLNKSHGKFIANLCLIASKCLMKGGNISLETKKIDSTIIFKMIARSEQIKIPNEMLAIFKNHESCNINLSNVQIHYVAKIAKLMGVVVSCHEEKNKFSIIATVEN